MPRTLRGTRGNRRQGEPLRLFPVPLLLSLATGCVSPPATDRTTAPILDGADDRDDPAVVFLGMGGMSCTGSVIDPRIILTARHCLEGADPGWVEVIVGFNPGARDARAIASQGDIADFHLDDGVGDLALIESGVDLDVAPLAFSRDAGHPSDGSPVESAGYGMHSEWEQADGNKRRGAATVTGNDGFEIYTTPITCYGDSGGPLFDEQGVVVGVTSRGTAGTCSDGEAIFANVGNAADWIAGFLTVDPVEPDPGGDDPGGGDPGGDDPGGGGGDPAPDPGGDDPGPAPDPGEPSGLGQFGESCDRAQACASQACVTLGEGAGYCTEPCTDACPYGYECTSTDSGHFCMFGGTDRGPGGDPLGPEGTAGYAGREGCSAAPRRADPSGGTLLLALALLLWRPRRPARSEPQPTREVTRAVDPLLSSRLPV